MPLGRRFGPASLTVLSGARQRGRLKLSERDVRARYGRANFAANVMDDSERALYRLFTWTDEQYASCAEHF